MSNPPKPGKNPAPPAPVVPIHRLPPRERSATKAYDAQSPEAKAKRERQDTQRFETERSTDEHEIPIELQIPAAAPAPVQYDLFGVAPIKAGVSFTKLGEAIPCAIVILQGEALEFTPSGKPELAPGRRLGPGSLVWHQFFDDDIEEPLSPVEVVAETDLLIYQITTQALETSDLILRLRREKYVRTLLLRHAESVRQSDNAELQARIQELTRKVRELNSMAHQSIKQRVDDLVGNHFRPLEAENIALKQRVAEFEPWIEALFQYVPWFLKDREADKESMKQFIELILDERYELYDAIRGDLLELLAACQQIDPKKSAPLNAAILGLMAKLDETFKRNMPRVNQRPL